LQIFGFLPDIRLQLKPYQRWFGLVAVFFALLGLAVLALAFAHAWEPEALDSGKRAKCFETFSTAQWPKWIGCAMAAHENLAGGLVGLWAALSAAWLAYSSVQEQFEEERKRTREQFERDHEQTARRNAEAKSTARVALVQVTQAASSTLFAITQAQDAQDQQQIDHWDGLVTQGVSFIQKSLDHFSLREAARDLSVEDRIIYLAIVSRLAAFVMIYEGASPLAHLSRKTRLQNQYIELMLIREFLAPFDAELTAAFDRDAEGPPTTA
jgi:hypothetical protein